MALFQRSGLFERISAVYQGKRFRGKINIQKPRIPHFERAKFLALAKPYYINPKKGKPMIELCNKAVNIWERKEIENPYQRIIARELLNWFRHSRLIAFFHKSSMSSDEQYRAYVMFRKEQMHCKYYGKKTLQMAVQGTPYEAVLSFYVSHNMIVFSNDTNVKQLVQVAKKFPQLVLLAAVLEDRLISKDDIMYYSVVSDLKTAQVGLAGTLDSVGTHLVGQLSTHQNTLISQLQERAKQLEQE